MIDVRTLDDPTEALWLAQLQQLTRELIAARTSLACQIQEYGERPAGTPYIGGQPLLRRRDSLTGSSWFVLDREHLWWIATGTRPSDADTDRGPARACRLQRTLKLDMSLETLLGRLNRLQAEAAAAGIRWADLVSSAVAG